MLRGLFITGLCFLFIFHGIAQQNDTTLNWELMDMSLNDLVNIQVEAASKEQTNLLNSPAIITVLTENEITQTGAQTLMELLSFVPGFDFSAEWDNVIGLGIRGNNATEGKYLIMVDGFELNETNFGSFSFNHHLLLDNIKKIEVIRGPGSVMYGGIAELAVINIITKTGTDLNGRASVSTMGSVANNALLNTNVQAMFGEKRAPDFNYSISVGYQNGNASNASITTLDTTPVNYADSSQIVNGTFQFQAQYKKLLFNFIYDNYSTENTESSGSVEFNGIYTSLSQELMLGQKFIVKPTLKYKQQHPWYFANNKEKEFYNTVNQRLQGGVELHYKATEKIGWVSGLEYYADESQKENDTVMFSKNNQNQITFSNSAVYSEIVCKSDLGYLNLGFRYDYHSHYKGNFAPRIAYTKTLDLFHIKLLYSQAYKSPTIYNIDYNLNISPEKTRVFEIEAGAIISNKADFVINLFDIYIDNPIIYVPNELTGADYYKNEDKTGSRGIELTSRFIPVWGYFSFSYSYYTAANNSVAEYEVESNSKLYGAYPAHRANLVANFKLKKHLMLGTAFKFNSTRYTYIHADKEWSYLQEKQYDPTLIINTFVRYNVLPTLTVDAGIKNLTNSDTYFLNAYRGGQNPIPGIGRTFYAKLAFNFDRK